MDKQIHFIQHETVLDHPALYFPQTFSCHLLHRDLLSWSNTERLSLPWASSELMRESCRCLGWHRRTMPHGHSAVTGSDWGSRISPFLHPSVQNQVRGPLEIKKGDRYIGWCMQVVQAILENLTNQPALPQMCHNPLKGRSVRSSGQTTPQWGSPRL